MYKAQSLKRRFLGTKGEGRTLLEAIRNDADLMENMYGLILEHYRSQEKEYLAWAKRSRKAPSDSLKKDWIREQARAEFTRMLDEKTPLFELCQKVGIPFPVRVPEFFCRVENEWVPTERIVGACHNCQYPLTTLQPTCPSCRVALALDKCRHCGNALRAGKEIEFCARHVSEHRWF